MQQSTTTFRAAIKAARRASTPLICIRTADPASAISHVIATLNGTKDTTPLVVLDIVNGLQGRNEAGQDAVGQVLNGAKGISSISKGLTLLANIADDSIVFFLNPHRTWEGAQESPAIIQAIWNLRDVYKVKGQQLIMITTLGATLPAELQNDVTIFDEPLPNVAELEVIIKNTFEAASLKQPDDATRMKIIDALIGLASFPAEQVLAMSVSKTGIDLERLWERKCQAIEANRGLSVWRGKEKFADVRGCDGLVEYMTALMQGDECARLVVLVDEINDALAGAGTDTSGVKGDMVGTLLSHMQNNNSDGVLLIGPPGTGKTLIGKATASVADRIMVVFDFAGMQDSLVGESGSNMRGGLSIVDAMSQGRTLWIATCNSLSNLPPQLRRRFRDGTFFVDIPDASGREALWQMYEKRFGVSGAHPDDEGWTGAEIENCCRKAKRLKMTLKEAAKFIVPVSKSAAEDILALRKQAHNTYLSASKPGVYIHSENRAAATSSVAKPGTRKINTEN